ncbi:MAG: hypothetical protein IJZ44_06060 [Lachnospiraceae bacterium]|nr:hypothetical protein [Lachnospiraceae bacterium]
MENEQEEDINKVAAKVYFQNKNHSMPDESVWLEANHWRTLYALLDQVLIDRCQEQAEIDVFTRWKEGQDKEKGWNFKYRKTYIHPFFIPDYMFLKTSDRLWRNTWDVSNKLCIHVPSGTTFHVYRRASITFGPAVMEDKRNIFYKFKYVGDDGTVTPMIIHTHTKELPDDDEIRHIKYEILKNAAQWFCEHLQSGSEGYLLGDEYHGFY